VVPATYWPEAISHVKTLPGEGVLSRPLRTRSVSGSIVQRETKAPLLPWARTAPGAAAVISWFMSSVNSRCPLRKAPSPSGIPTMR